MAKTIVTQFGEFLNYANIVKIGIITNWEDAEIDEESGTITPDYEMIATDNLWASMQSLMKQNRRSKSFMTGCRRRRMPSMRSQAVSCNALRL